MDTVLVTGAVGRIGSYVVRALSPRYRLILTDIVQPQTPPGHEFVALDLATDLSRLVEITRGVQRIVHLAAIPVYTGEDEKIYRTNVMGTINVYEAARINRVEQVVSASSICATGFIFNQGELVPAYFPVDEQHPCKPDDAYGLSKLMLEQLAYAYAVRYGLRSVCLRLATVWLPEHDETDELLEILSDKVRAFTGYFAWLQWQYVDVRDVAAAFRLALEYSGDRFAVFNIGAPDAPARHPAALLARLYPGVPLLPSRLRRDSPPSGPLWCIDKAAAQLGYRPAHSWSEYPACHPLF